MKPALTALLSLALLGCGAQPAATPTPVAEAGPAAAPPTIAGRLPCAGARLPITSACAVADDALFGATNPTRGLLDPKCVWRTNEVKVTDTQALVFRDQDCTGAGWAPMIYTYGADVGLFARRGDAAPDESGIVALQLFPLAQGQTAEQAALKTLDLAPPEQRARCIIKPATRSDVKGPAFSLDPTEELQKELDTLNQGDIYDACGPYGFTDADIFWEARPGLALFHALGQDDPYWDPKSFTFYTRDASGDWRRTDG